MNNMFKSEKIFYFSTWTLAVLYSLYSFSRSSYLYFRNYKDTYDDFSTSFNYIPSKRDKSDFEWEAIYYLMKHFFPWLFLYITGSEFIRNSLSPTKVIQAWQICFTIVLMFILGGFYTIFVILLQPIIFYLICSLFKNKMTTWLCTGFGLLLITQCKKINSNEKFVEFLNVNSYQIYFILLSLFWMNLKCTSYFLEEQSSKKLLDFLSYCLYPPTIFTGPFIPPDDFLIINQPLFEPLWRRVRRLFLNLCRSIFWFLFTNLCLHFIYVNATGYQKKLVKNFDNWSLYGYGYAMGQFFHIKYVVMYGLSTSFASFENVEVPRLPRCIGRVHLYSDMWKYFDPGLYKFLIRYIYVPLCKICNYKLIASYVCFLFVYVWHGVENYILIWAVLNYVGIVLEHVCNLAYKKYFMNNFAKKNSTSSVSKLRRLKCIAASPLLMMSAVSNFYFFAGTDIGNIFVFRIFQDGIIRNAILLFALYCCCQVSTELQNTKARKM